MIRLAIWILSWLWKKTAGLSRWDENAFFANDPIRVSANGNLLIDGLEYRLWGVEWPMDGSQCQQHLTTLLQWRKVYVMTAASWGQPGKVRLFCGRGDLNKQLITDRVAKKFTKEARSLAVHKPSASVPFS